VDRELHSFLNKFIAPLKRRVMLMVGRCVLSAVNDSNGMQEVKIDLLADETLDEVERFQNYGFTSNPLSGAEGVTVFVSGDRSHGIVIAMDDRRYRLKGLEDGEVALYTDEGDKIHFKRGNKIDIETKELTINAQTKTIVNAPAVELSSGVLEKILNGESFQTVFNNHVHVGNLGVPTAPPLVPSTPADLSTKVKAAK